MFGKHLVWISNQGAKKRVPPEALEEFTRLGWHRGLKN